MVMEPILQGIMISVTGMALVFGALILLWGLMALLVRVGTPGARPHGIEGPVTQGEPTIRPKAGHPLPTEEETAAIAVALAILRSEQEAEAALGWRLPPVLTRWLAIGYSRQLHSWQPRRTKRDA